MLYYIQPGDTLYSIANRFNTTIQAILNANIICNPNLIYRNQPIIIPQSGIDLPLSGGSPYYIVLPGDTLGCLAVRFGSSVEALAMANQISNPNLINEGAELLIPLELTSPEDLKERWENLSTNCELINPLQVHGTLYFDSFRWEALGTAAFPYLLDLLNNPCDIIRYYAVISLGRIGRNGQIQQVLNNMLNDPAGFVVEATRLAIRRIELLKRRSKRTHVALRDTILLREPNLNSSGTLIPEGSAVISLKWHIPSPTQEEGPRGDIQMYDWFQDIRTGAVGYMPRAAYREITVV